MFFVRLTTRGELKCLKAYKKASTFLTKPNARKARSRKILQMSCLTLIAAHRCHQAGLTKIEKLQANCCAVKKNSRLYDKSSFLSKRNSFGWKIYD